MRLQRLLQLGARRAVQQFLGRLARHAAHRLERGAVVSRQRQRALEKPRLRPARPG
jgi:hypothetical protein